MALFPVSPNPRRRHDRLLWHDQPLSAGCPVLHPDHEQLTVDGCWQTVAVVVINASNKYAQNYLLVSL